ncbi:MAG: glycine--tRNA ligase [Pseudomonadota bacterium]
MSDPKIVSESNRSVSMEKIVSLCKRRGIIFPSSEIYGGLNGCWDYGPLGVELKRNIKNAWWQNIVTSREDVSGVDASILMHPRVWQASGHVEEFTDPLVDCKKCKHRFKADSLDSDNCPDCGGPLTEARRFNLMFKTFVGPVEEDAATVHLRPETAQGIFVNFENVLNTARAKLPFGIAQIGKAFRNEINPRNFTFRSREFEQMEMEYFVDPSQDEKWYEYWCEKRLNWYLDLGIRKENLRMRDHAKDELAHYAKACADIEYHFPFGWAELEGVANRKDYDLVRHSEYSGKRLDYFDETKKERFVPYVIEPSAGVDRSMLAFVVDAYAEEEERTVLRFHPKIAPIKIGVFPLLRKEGQPEKALKIRDTLKQHFAVFYDQAGAIGRRYRRQDEIGTPFCITVDHQTADDSTVTLRERDTMDQERIPIDNLVSLMREKLGA